MCCSLSMSMVSGGSGLSNCRANVNSAKPIIIFFEILVSIMVVFWGLFKTWGQEPQQAPQTSYGVYQGQVVELSTNQSLPGAVVVVFWMTDDDTVFAMREVLTNAAGEFLVDASAVEAVPRGQNFTSRILIYKPGYASFPTKFKIPPGSPANEFAGKRSIVMLRRLHDEDERVEAFNMFAMSVKRLGLFSSETSLKESALVIFRELEYFGATLEKRPESGER